ncbi:MAG: hypothetical protein RR969_09460 [Thermomonas sp.]
MPGSVACLRTCNRLDRRNRAPTARGDPRISKRNTMRTFAVMLVLAGLAGCDQKAPDTTAVADTEGKTEAATATTGTPAGWNAADACSILDKAAVAEVLGREIASTQLSLVHEADANNAATSECAYLGADGASVARLMTRWSPINDNTPEAIAMARSTTAASMKAFSDVPLEDIPGLGQAAFLAPTISQLNVFIDEARMLVVTVEKVPDGAQGKDLAVSMAKKAGA